MLCETKYPWNGSNYRLLMILVMDLATCDYKFSAFFTFLMVKVQGFLEVTLLKSCFNLCDILKTKVKVNLDKSSFHFQSQNWYSTWLGQIWSWCFKKALTRSLSCNIVMMGTCILCVYVNYQECSATFLIYLCGQRSSWHKIGLI